MRIVSIAPRAETNCVDPTIVLDVVLGFFRGQRLPVDVAVQIRTEDKKLLGVARALTSAHPERIGLDANESGSQTENTLPVQVALSLTPKQLDYLDGLRAKHRKGDVVLECTAEAVFLVSKIVNARLKVGPQVQAQQRAEESGAMVVYQSSTRDSFYSQQTNMWILSGDGGRTYLERETLRYAATLVIGSSDWLHDYVTPWRTTRYMVVELPQQELLTSAPNIEQRVNTAIEAANRAMANLARGEWNDVIEDLRAVWELLRNQDIAGVLQRDGYPQDAIAAFTTIVQQQFTLASKFLHRVDQTGQRINPEIRASKEDAMVCLSAAMSLLNLIARKAVRLS